MDQAKAVAQKLAGVTTRDIVPSGNFEHPHGTAICCPVCLGDYVHATGIKDVYGIDGNDSYESGRGVRGDVIAVPMKCENGHNFELNIGFHKGNTYLSVSIIGNPETTPPGSV